jgi:hypothetical protein
LVVSTTLICGLDSDKDAVCHVLASDPDQSFGFSTQGSAYWVYASGVASKKPGMSTLSGDWLMEALPWRVPLLEVKPTVQTANESYGRWLLADANPEPIKLSAAGLWVTHNASVVAVSRRSNGQWGATIARGGHGLPDMAGSGPGSTYTVAESGAVVWQAKGNSSDDLRTLAVVSGMALMRTTVEVLDLDGKRLEIMPG